MPLPSIGFQDRALLHKKTEEAMYALGHVLPASEGYTRDHLLHVLMHILSGALKERDPDFVAQYFLGITGLLDKMDEG